MTFTPFGAEAFNHYKVIASDILIKYDHALESHTAKEKDAIYLFLQHVEKILGEVF